MKKVLLLSFIGLLFWGCPSSPGGINDQILEVGTVEGMKPIYSPISDWQQVKGTDPIPIEKLGKIYYNNGFIFVNEKFKGVHVIDNSDPGNPVKVKFIEIIGNKDIAIKGNRLYADNYTDLITLDISDLNNITVLSRLKNIYPAVQQAFPDSFVGYFECVDDNKGIILGWEEAVLENPECWR